MRQSNWMRLPIVDSKRRLCFILMLFVSLGCSTAGQAAPSQQAYLKASNTGINDRMGNSVAVAGDTAVVGAHLEDSNATSVNGDQNNDNAPDAGAAYVFVRSGTNWLQQAYLKASNAEADDEFGLAVDISGDTVVVGAHNEDSNATGSNGDGADNSVSEAGAAYVFVRTNANWIQQAYIKPSNPADFHRFGNAVAIDDDTIVIGSSTENSGGNLSGAAYVFVRDGTNWTEQAFLKASNLSASDRFGSSVDIDGNTLVVGAFREGNDEGAAYVFVRFGSNWLEQAYLKASNPDLDDNFGRSVAISGDTVIVGANEERSNATGVNGNQTDNSANEAGAAYIFVRSGTNWTQQAYLKASNTGAGDQFGQTVAIHENKAVVGALFEASNATGVNGNESNNSAFHAGAAYVFSRNGVTWTQQAYLKASNSGFTDWFGRSVAVDGNTVLIGTYGDDSNATGVNGDDGNGSAGASGAAFVFVETAAIPAIVQQPLGQTVLKGANTLFSISATDATGFQWLFNGMPLAGQTAATLSLSGLHRTNSGLYAAIVTGTSGSVTSSPARLRVLAPQRLREPISLGDGQFRLIFRDDDDLGRPDDLTKLELHWRTNLPSGTDTNWQVITNGFSAMYDLIQVELEAGAATRRFYRIMER